MHVRAGDPARFSRAERQLARPSTPTRLHYLDTDDGSRYLRWPGLFEFLISRDGRRVEYHQSSEGPAESLATYLLGQALSFSLLALGFEPLHATVVAVGDRAIALVGDCGYGKSTLAAALVARGLPVLTDDLMVLEPRGDGWMVQPGIPRLKLFPSAARRVLGHHQGGIPMNDRTAKLVIPLGARQSISRALPLKALYLLPEPGRRTGVGRHVRIEPVSGSGAFLEIVRAAFNSIVTDKQRLASQFAFAERLTASVPIRRLSYRRSFASLQAVCSAILADVAESGGPSLRIAAAKRIEPSGSSTTI